MRLIAGKYGITPQVFYNCHYYTMENIFRQILFLYSPCPNLPGPEGIKDALSYRFRRLVIGQNCCAVYTNEGARV